MSVLILLLLLTHVFFSKLLIIFCNVFRSCPFSQNIFVRYSISAFKYFSEQILVALARNPLNMLVIVLEGIEKCIISTFARAGLRWTSNSYLPLLFFIFISRKFKHFSSLSSSILNWICLACLFKIVWNSRDYSLDLNRAWMSSTYRLYIFRARFKFNASAMALCSKFWT